MLVGVAMIRPQAGLSQTLQLCLQFPLDGSAVEGPLRKTPARSLFTKEVALGVCQSADRATESLKLVLWAAVAPQQDQSSTSLSSIPSAALTALTDWSYSLAVAWSEHPG